MPLIHKIPILDVLSQCKLGMDMSNCWICGAPADSREHKIKRTDLKDVAGEFSQTDPIYISTDQRRNKQIGSLDAKALKYMPSLCQYCNNTRTKPFDEAWTRLSRTLRANISSYCPGDTIRANRIFPYNTRHHMRHVHLYIVKMLGCRIVEGDVKEIDIEPFSKSILNEKVHLNVYAAFGPEPMDEYKGLIIGGDTELQLAKMINGRCAFAVLIHQVGELWVRVMYALDGEDRQGLINSWNPRYGSKTLTITNFMDN